MEWYRSGHNGADSKSVCEQSHVGSNPTHSAIKRTGFPIGGIRCALLCKWRDSNI